jgi:tRNA-splicing ligase RtcB
VKKRELENLGFRRGPALQAAVVTCAHAARAGVEREQLRADMREIAADPARFTGSEIYGTLAKLMVARAGSLQNDELRNDLTYASWGDDIDEQARAQMDNACRLPVSRAAALMPDAHLGYGLPIGGVLATENAVIPYAVGVDIACRVMLTVFDVPADALDDQRDRLREALERNTLFGVGKNWTDKKPHHEVLDEPWDQTPLIRKLKDTAWKQLGTSGSGNHFVEFGEIELVQNVSGGPGTAGSQIAAWSADENAPKRRLALLSHSGSRGPGSQIAGHYSRLAQQLHPTLPKQLSHLAWLPMDGDGAEYWEAMELMGRFASANHHVIHRRIAADLRESIGAEVSAQVENHHNFAWKETHEIDGQRKEVIVHRKGATPAGRGELGFIPGSMADPGYLVEGLGDPRSLDSASHGAGRKLSRRRAKETIRRASLEDMLRRRGVELLSAGLDESPHAYKDIDEVMAAQSDLVRPIARFFPRLVKMAPDGEKPED